MTSPRTEPAMAGAYRMFNILDEFTREVLMIRVKVLAELQSTGLSAFTP